MDENPYKSPQTSDPTRTDQKVERSAMRADRSGSATLTARDIFGIVVRTIGLATIAYASWEASGMVAPAPGFNRIDYLIAALPVLIIGGVLLFAADTIVAMAYRSGEHDDDEQPDDR